MAILSGRSTTDIITGGYIHIIIPRGAAPSGYDSFRISVADLQANLQSQITDNETDIIDHESRITKLEDNSSKILESSQGVTYDFTQSGDSEIEKIYINLDGGAPIVSVGTTPGGTELIGNEIITDQYKKDINFSKGFTAASRTIYVTITGGSVDIAFYSVESIFN